MTGMDGNTKSVTVMGFSRSFAVMVSVTVSTITVSMTITIVRFSTGFSRPLAIMVVTITVSVTGVTVDGTADIVSGFGISFSLGFGFSIGRSLAQVVTISS